MYGAVENLGMAASGGTQGITQGVEKQLGKEDFLKLLVAQMENQDPLNPTSNEDMVLQLAQFSAIEQTEQMNGSLTTFIGQNTLGAAQGVLGKMVEGSIAEGEGENAKIVRLKGLASEVRIVDGEAKVVVGNKTLSVKNILNVSENPFTLEMAQMVTGFVGKYVELKTDDGVVEGMVSEVKFDEGKALLVVNEKSYGVGDLLSIKNELTDSSAGVQ